MRYPKLVFSLVAFIAFSADLVFLAGQFVLAMPTIIRIHQRAFHSNGKCCILMAEQTTPVSFRSTLVTSYFSPATFWSQVHPLFHGKSGFKTLWVSCAASCAASCDPCAEAANSKRLRDQVLPLLDAAVVRQVKLIYVNGESVALAGPSSDF
jgi:hypothetical protein